MSNKSLIERLNKEYNESNKKDTKSNTLNEYVNTSKHYLGTSMLIGAIALATSQLYNPRADPEDITLQNAPNNYHLIEYNIDTKGTIQNIFLDTANMFKETIGNGDTIAYHGAIGYTIKPSETFKPSGEAEQGHVDKKGNQYDDKYFTDTRLGSVTFARNK